MIFIEYPAFCVYFLKIQKGVKVGVCTHRHIHTLLKEHNIIKELVQFLEKITMFIRCNKRGCDAKYKLSNGLIWGGAMKNGDLETELLRQTGEELPKVKRVIGLRS